MRSIQDRQRIERLERRVKALPKGLQSHIYRVVDIAEDLADVHDIDPTKARIGMLAHDLAPVSYTHLPLPTILLV